MVFPIVVEEEEEVRRYVVQKSDNAAFLSPRTLFLPPSNLLKVQGIGAGLHSSVLESCNWPKNRAFSCTFICL